MNLDRLLELMVREDASDAFLTAGAPPSIKIHGRIRPVSRQPMSAESVRETVLACMDHNQQQEFLLSHECNFALVRDDIGRFRASAYFQREQCAMVLRRIKTEIPRFDELGVPPILEELSMARQGLVIMVGATGTGKSTTLAAMIGHRNRHSSDHIICIEDPIEYVHEHGNSLISQREVGADTESFEVALRNTLRQAPDVIMIGEVRTATTMAQAITFAETGHLCLCTLHANNANQALDRILSFFPVEQHNQLLMDLSLNLRGMIAQQLVPTADGRGLAAVIEVMLNAPLLADHIRAGDIHLIKELMSKSTHLGMQTMDQALYALVRAQRISEEEALRHADSANNLRLMLKLDHGVTPPELHIDRNIQEDPGRLMR